MHSIPHRPAFVEAHPPLILIVASVPETGATPATLLEVETHNAHCEYLEIVNYFVDHPWQETDAASDEIARRLTRWQRFKAELEARNGR